MRRVDEYARTELRGVAVLAPVAIGRCAHHGRAMRVAFVPVLERDARRDDIVLFWVGAELHDQITRRIGVAVATDERIHRFDVFEAATIGVVAAE